jgi:8-hydroxy-5-deazaflavin:NADPH oxidoreductase
MSGISFIGLGGMTRAIAARAVLGGNAVEVIGRDAAKAKDLAAALGGGATAGTFGTAPAGDIVILAVPYASAVPVVARYGDALAGKVIIDISNTFTTASATRLVTPDGTSGAQEIAKAAPASAHVVKAFNTVFGHVLAQGRPLDVLIAGDDVHAKASVSAFIKSLGLRPLDTGDLAMAHWLEGTGLLMMGLARHGVGNFNFTLGVNLPG